MARPPKAAAAAKPGVGQGGGHRLAGLALVEPFQQGEFDGLCGSRISSVPIAMVERVGRRRRDVGGRVALQSTRHVRGDFRRAGT